MIASLLAPPLAFVAPLKASALSFGKVKAAERKGTVLSMARKEKERPMRRLDWAVAATSGTFMVGSVLAGLLIGWWLDKRFGIDPVGKAIGVIFGGIAGTIELVRMLTRVPRQ